MYSFITNPITKKKTSVFSKKGQEIIKKYTIAQGGSLRTLSKASQLHQLPDSVYFDARKQWYEDPNGRERMLELEKHSNTKISKLATHILGNYANLVEIEIQNLHQSKNLATSTSGVPEIYKGITRDKELLENIITKKTDINETVSSIKKTISKNDISAISPEYERMKQRNIRNPGNHFSLSPVDEPTNFNTRRGIRREDEYDVVYDEFEEEESEDSEEWYAGDEFEDKSEDSESEVKEEEDMDSEDVIDSEEDIDNDSEEKEVEDSDSEEDIDSEEDSDSEELEEDIEF